jgi:hypothetical protein
MHNAEGHKQFKNYLELFPVDPLAKIIFYLPETVRRSTIAKMPEFKEALLKHDDNLRNLSQKALALVQEDKDFKAAAAMVQKHRRLLTKKFCKAMAKWMRRGQLASKITAMTQFMQASAKEIDNTCTFGTLASDVAETQLMDSDDEEDFNWTEEGEDFAKVIWIRFGSVTVHYQFMPTCSMFEGEGTEVEGRVELNVYKHVAADQYISGKIVCFWGKWIESHHHYYESRCEIRQLYGNIEISEEAIIQGAAIGLAAGVGRESPASTLAHDNVPNAIVTMENIACAMRFAGRRFKSLTAINYYDAEEFMDLMC